MSKAMRNGGVLFKGGALREREDDEVGPLLTTQWYQMSPYNMYCPSGTKTGCVATAMAQVLKYWNYPAFGKGSHSYSDDTGYPDLSADFGDTRYDWQHMPNRLTGSSSATEKQAVATLMFHCGVSVNMHYSTVYSGTTIIKCENALPEYFRFNDSDIRYRSKGQMSNDDWTDTLIAELRLHRPFLHGGSGPAGGHCFVCDGYDSHRYLHFLVCILSMAFMPAMRLSALLAKGDKSNCGLAPVTLLILLGQPRPAITGFPLQELVLII